MANAKTQLKLNAKSGKLLSLYGTTTTDGTNTELSAADLEQGITGGSVSLTLPLADGTVTITGTIAGVSATGSGTPQPPQPAQPSANKTTVTTVGPAIVDASGVSWTITAQGQIAKNGVVDTSTSNVVELAYILGTVWQLNKAGLWYAFVSNAWAAGIVSSPLAPVATTTPLPTTTPKPTTTPAPTTAPTPGAISVQINTTKLTPTNTYGLNMGGDDYYDSITDSELLEQNPGLEAVIHMPFLSLGSDATANQVAFEFPYTQDPANYWKGAQWRWRTGANAGLSGLITGSVTTLNTAAETGPGPILQLDKPVPNKPTAADRVEIQLEVTPTAGVIPGWWPGAGTLILEQGDISPNSPGKWACLMTPDSSGTAVLGYYQDTLAAHSFLTMNGTYVVSFRAKPTTSAATTLTFNLGRATTYTNQTVMLKPGWNDYSLTFQCSETASHPDTAVHMTFTVNGPTLFDDASLRNQADTGPLRSPHAAWVKQFAPRIARFWIAQQVPYPMLLEPQTAQAPCSPGLANFPYDASGVYPNDKNCAVSHHSYPQAINIALQVGAPSIHLIQNIGADTTEWQMLMDFLCSTDMTTQGAQLRAAAGFTQPINTLFKTVYIEFGNEPWNTNFNGQNDGYNGADTKTGWPYLTRLARLVPAIKAMASFPKDGSVQLIGGLQVQGVAAPTATDAETVKNTYQYMWLAMAQAAVPAMDRWAVMQYWGNNISYGKAPQIVATSSAADVMENWRCDCLGRGMDPTSVWYRMWEECRLTNTPYPYIYEGQGSNEGLPVAGSMNALIASQWSGLCELGRMMAVDEQFGAQDQCLFTLEQWGFGASNGTVTPLWGMVVGIDGTTPNLDRPVAIAAKLWQQAAALGKRCAVTYSGQNVKNGMPLTYPGVFTDGNGNYALLAVNYDTADKVLALNLNPKSAMQITQQLASSVSATNEAETANVGIAVSTVPASSQVTVKAGSAILVQFAA